MARKNIWTFRGVCRIAVFDGADGEVGVDSTPPMSLGRFVMFIMGKTGTPIPIPNILAAMCKEMVV